MDDCNKAEAELTAAASEVQIPLWTIVTIARSSSSETLTVQIPLWTIVTDVIQISGDRVVSSDSSMDDCNGRPRRKRQP